MGEHNVFCHGAILHCDDLAGQVLPLDYIQSFNVRRSKHNTDKELTIVIKTFIERAYHSPDSGNIRRTLVYFDRDSALRGVVSTH